MAEPGHFIIGAGVTNDPSIPKVKDDLGIVVDYFTRKLGYTHALPELMDSPATDTFRRTLSQWFAAPERTANDQIVLYFSGHGEVAERGNRHYLILSDSNEERLAATGFETASLAAIPFENGPIKRLLAILDTCYSGAGLSDAAAFALQIHSDTDCLLQIISSARKRDFAKDGLLPQILLRPSRTLPARWGGTLLDIYPAVRW
jgi:hypothetical protein